MRVCLSHAHSEKSPGAVRNLWFCHAMTEWHKSKKINELVKELLKESDIEVEIIDPPAQT